MNDIELLICPFCDYQPSSYEATVWHIRRSHCHRTERHAMSCFCMEFFTTDMTNQSMHLHFQNHGGLHAHAQDFLMGVAAKEES